VAGLTQEELAERAGLSVNAISVMERGLTRAPHKDTVELLAEALRLPQEERAEFVAAARGRLVSVLDPMHDTTLPLVQSDEDQAQVEQPATSPPLTPAIFASQVERLSPPENALPEKLALLPAKRKRKRVVLLLITLLVVVAASSGTAYWLRLGPFGNGAATTATSSPAYAYAQPTHMGGTITFSETGGLLSANSWFDIGSLNTALWGAPYTVSPTGVLLPDELAEIPMQANRDVSQDGLTVTLHLRPDLRWSDGQPLTADDFVYWLEVELDPRTGASTCCFGYDQIASSQPLNAHTLVLHYNQVFAPFLTYLPWAAPRHA
jgi:transcriptional regulator with XRE-family HTH domain